MPRSDYEITEYPFRTWVLTVDESNRIRPPRDLSTVVPWIDLARPRIDCVAYLGSLGGVQIEPFTAYEREAQQLTDAIGTIPPTAADSRQKWTETARHLATAWRLSLNVEVNRISIVLPEPLRRTQELPQSGGAVVMFGLGEIVEIWDSVKWNDFVRSVTKKGEAIGEAIEALRER